MFDKTKVETAYLGIVGINNPSNPEYAIIDTANQSSTSGYMVNDISLAKIEFFKDSQDYEGISDVNFNDLLRTIQKSSITSVCNQVFNTEDFRDRNVLYKHATNNINPETLIDGFVGYEIKVTREKNVAFEITRVILDFQGNYPNDITLQLYNTGDPNPIESKVITISEQHQEVVLNWVVDNSGDTYKGNYYLGYIKSASTPIPFKRNYNNANILSIVDGLRINPVKVVGHTGSILFDLDNTEGLSENIGVNPDITVYDDYTDFIKQNRSLFGRAIQLEMAIRMIQESFSSLRVNRNNRISDEKVVQVIDGVEAENGKLKILGLRPRLFSEITMIKKEVEKLRLGYFGGRIKVVTKV
jgi:hypothetical protein